MLGVSVALLLVAVSLLLGYSRWRHSYWSSKGIGVPSGYPILGNMPNLILGKPWIYMRNAYKLYSEEKVFGIYEIFKPSLSICDPNMIRHILVKDFDHFTDRREFSFNNDETKFMNEMLSVINGPSWKRLRATMSPTFSSGKMKQMFSIVHNQSKNFITHCEEKMKKNEKFDIKSSFGFFTMDVIAASAFGIECNSLMTENPIFAKNAEKVFSSSLLDTIKLLLIMLFPTLMNKLGITIGNNVWSFFKNVSKETLAERRRNQIKRGDFLDLMLEEQEKQKEGLDESKDYKITDTTILAESVLFLVAGYETTANALSLTCFHLAKYPEFQNKLREEIKDMFDDKGDVNYYELMEAKYLDACVSETLRLVSPVPTLERKCTKEYKLEGTDIIIPEGMLVSISTWGLHRDPVYWPDPNEYKPERFLPENKANIVPFTYMPFGLGPRNCIAMRFALMEAKLCLAVLIKNFEISLAPGYEELKLESGGGIVRPQANTVVVSLKKSS